MKPTYEELLHTITSLREQLKDGNEEYVRAQQEITHLKKEVIKLLRKEMKV